MNFVLKLILNYSKTMGRIQVPAKNPKTQTQAGVKVWLLNSS